MANVNLNDVELKIDLIASLENSVQTGADKNHWSVDWDLNYLLLKRFCMTKISSAFGYFC